MATKDDEEERLRSVALQNAQSILHARRLAEEALRKQSEWLRVTLSSIGDAVISTDAEGRVTFMNGIAESLTGWPQAEALGRPLPDVFHIINEKSREPVENPALRALREGVVVGLANHTLLIMKDGTERPIDDSAAPIQDEQGHAVGCVLVFRDVAEKRRAEEALRRSEERYRSLTQAIVSVVWTVDEAGRFVTAQPSWSQFTGQTWDEYRDFGWANALHPDDRERVRSLWEAARAARTLYESDGRLWHAASGSYRHFEARGVPILNPDGSVREWVGKCLDVHDRKQAEVATRQRSEQVRRLAEVATRLNALHDVPSIMGLVNEEARSLIGSHQSVSSMTVNEDWQQSVVVVSFSDKYAKWRGYDEKPDGSGIYSLVCRTNKPMRLTQAELEAHPAWKGFGRHAPNHPPLRGWLAVPFTGLRERNVGLIQVSDKYEGEFTADDEAVLVQLAQMAAVAIDNSRLVEDLRDTDRRKNEFLAMLAHELRNPLAPIRNAVQVMQLMGGNSEGVRSASEMMERQIGQMVRLVDDLLDVSRISRGKIELRRGRIELASAVNHAVEASRPTYHSKGLALTVTLPPTPVYLNADPTRLAQVVGNLLNNACKFTEKGGRIELVVRVEWRVVSEEKTGEFRDDRATLSGAQGVANGNELGRTMLPGNEELSEGRTIRHDDSDSASGSVDPRQHRRGTGPAAYQGVGSRSTTER